MSLTMGRLHGVLPGLAVALALAGCNAQHQGELTANVAANAPAAAPQPEPAAERVDIAPNGVPLPPVRPDFARLAQENARQAQPQGQQSAAAGSQPAPDAAPEGVTSVAQSHAAARQATGLFSIFAGAPVDPAQPGQVQVAAAAGPASDAPVLPGSLAAYERRMSGDEPEDKPGNRLPTAASPSTGGAVIEVGGVTRQLAASSSPMLVGPSPRMAATFGAMAGQNWRPAYDHVVTNCFAPDLRAALENIARHFNSEVLVTSGHRDNGRRRSMHRTCRAADIRIVGVSPGTVARYASGLPTINGVGTYRRVAVTHIDTRENRMAWRY